MTNITFTEIVSDEIYSKGFDAGKKAAQKKYNKLFNASLAWLHIYESAYGTPDENQCPEYWELRKLLNMPS